MNRRKLSILIFVLLAVAWGTWFFWSVDEVQAIRHRVVDIARLASYTTDESPYEKRHAIGQLKAYFSSHVVLQINLQGRPPHLVEGRKMLMEGVQAIRFGVAQIQIKFLDIQVDWPPNSKHAQVHMTLSANFGVDQPTEYQEMKGTLEKTSDGWQVTRLETVKTWGR